MGGSIMASTINAKNTSTGVVITPDSSGQLELQTADTTRMTIDVNGNVGVGTSTLTNLLTLNASTPSIDFLSSGSAKASIISGGTGALAFYTGGILGGGGSERMRIDSSGKMLVNTTSTSSYKNGQFNVNGFSTFTSLSAGVASAIFNNDAESGTRFFTNFVINASVVGAITSTGTSTTYGTSSDYRLKENIAPMTGALNTVAQLKPVTYTWKSDGSDGQGFIAHELQAVVSDCVTGEKDAVDAEGNPVYQGIDTSFLVATLTAAIQEQQAIINDLKARIETLEGASA